MIEAKILLDSIQASGSHRLTTFLLTMPRYVLAEFNTHRTHSRNAASSRAIPIHKRISMVELNPFIPIEWGLDKPGMQASTVADPETAAKAEAIWLQARTNAVASAREMIELGIHKQIGNRLLEPFAFVQVLATAVETGWSNFFSLRADFNADPGIRDMAYKGLEAYNASIPQVLKPGQWHVPFGENMPEGLTEAERMKVLVARAARLSFNNFDGTVNTQKDFELHDGLTQNGHWSAFEHVAQVPDFEQEPLSQVSFAAQEHYVHTHQGNLPGWVQLRKTYPGECRVDTRVLKTVVIDGVASKVPA